MTTQRSHPGKTGDSFHDQAQQLLETPRPQVDQLTTKEQCTAQYQLLSEKLAGLRKAYIIEHDAEVKFKLKKNIEDAEADLTIIEQRLEALEHEETLCQMKNESLQLSKDLFL